MCGVFEVCTDMFILWTSPFFSPHPLESIWMIVPIRLVSPNLNTENLSGPVLGANRARETNDSRIKKETRQELQEILDS